MTEERRYREEEVAEIFEAAASPRPARDGAVAADVGLTLSELQTIGREVGVAPQRIADAASALDARRRALPRRSYLGMPVAVGRSVDLPRPPTDREWELLVGELRATFRARGRESSRGNVREWTNSNLHAYIEPTETGYRLRLGTLKGNASALNVTGAALVVTALFMVIMPFISGGSAEVATSALLGAMGAGAIGFNALRLPRWAREREEQMEYIAARAQALITADPAGPAPTPPSPRDG